MRNLVDHDNIALIYSRQAAQADTGYNHVLVTRHIFDNRGVYSNKGISQASPLYIFPTKHELDQPHRVNFDPTLYQKLQTLATDVQRGTPDEVAVFDYIYGVLHTPGYRQKYAEFLKSDFPRIPWPETPATFWAVSNLGGELRRLHLMNADAVGTPTYPFTGDGNTVVDKPRFADGKVWINATQGFEGVPEVAWGFYIGGYQPAQKWLKDRKGRALTFDDIKHYQKIIKVLVETDRVMKQLDQA